MWKLTWRGVRGLRSVTIGLGELFAELYPADRPLGTMFININVFDTVSFQLNGVDRVHGHGGDRLIAGLGQLHVFASSRFRRSLPMPLPMNLRSVSITSSLMPSIR